MVVAGNISAFCLLAEKKECPAQPPVYIVLVPGFCNFQQDLNTCADVIDPFPSGIKFVSPVGSFLHRLIHYSRGFDALPAAGAEYDCDFSLHGFWNKRCESVVLP